MPGPQLADDGSTVTLDLHGLTIDEALRLAQRLVAEAGRRGRATIKLVHGSSTSNGAYRSRSIKHELYDLLETGAFGTQISGHFKTEDVLVLSLPLSASADQRLIRLRDVLD
jgi:hypothetical protein